MKNKKEEFDWRIVNGFIAGIITCVFAIQNLWIPASLFYIGMILQFRL